MGKSLEKSSRRCRLRSPISAALVVLSIGWFQVSWAADQARDEPKLPDEPASATPAPAPEDDGWPDLSSFMDEPYGFLPIVSPITEPAVGYGVWGGPAFISEPQGKTEAGFGRPNITFLAGGWTENNTWLVMLQDERQWLDERLQTLVAAAYASVNLKFYGIGEDALLKDNPLRYNLQPVGGKVQVKYRLGRSCFWVGLGYGWVRTVATIDVPETLPNAKDIRRDSNVGGLLPLLAYDSRDNVFTPRRGTNVKLSANLAAKALGGDGEFQTVTLTVIQYVSLHPTLTVGVRGDGMLSFGEVPFYLLPSVSLRGAPSMRYQGEEVAQAELEVRWQFWKRLSLIGFGGYGAAWNDFQYLKNTVTVPTGGVGLRYDLARKYQVDAGLDVAFAPDGVAIYVQFGNAWMWK